MLPPIDEVFDESAENCANCAEIFNCFPQSEPIFESQIINEDIAARISQRLIHEKIIPNRTSLQNIKVLLERSSSTLNGPPPVKDVSKVSLLGVLEIDPEIEMPDSVNQLSFKFEISWIKCDAEEGGFEAIISSGSISGINHRDLYIQQGSYSEFMAIAAQIERLNTLLIAEGDHGRNAVLCIIKKILDIE